MVFWPVSFLFAFPKGSTIRRTYEGVPLPYEWEKTAYEGVNLPYESYFTALLRILLGKRKSVDNMQLAVGKKDQ